MFHPVVHLNAMLYVLLKFRFMWRQLDVFVFASNVSVLASVLP